MDTQPIILTVFTYNTSGFFSCCSIILETIILFFNKFQRLPTSIDTTNAFFWYKTPKELTQGVDIRSRYFKTRDDIVIPFVEPVYFTRDGKTYELGQVQYCNFSLLNHAVLLPFIVKYFTLSDYVMERVHQIMECYKIDCKNTMVLFHRGNDKALEMELPSYEEYVERAKLQLAKNPGLKIMIQSDETEFLVDMLLEFPDAIICTNHIRYMSKKTNNMEQLDHIISVDSYGAVFNTDNPEMSVNFLAIMYIMSKCHTIIATFGNCPLWVELFRFHIQES